MLGGVMKIQVLRDSTKHLQAKVLQLSHVIDYPLRWQFVRDEGATHLCFTPGYTAEIGYHVTAHSERITANPVEARLQPHGLISPS